MTLKNTDEHYGSVAKFFHWLMSVMILGSLIVGFTMTDMANTPDKFKLYGLHKSFGFTILTLVFLRLLWKISNKGPKLPDALNKIEKCLAALGHMFLYVLMFALPVTGWIMSSAAGFPVSVFGLFTLPNLVEPDLGMKRDFMEIHENLAFLLIFMVILHVLAALMHHVYHKNTILRRMLPFVK